MEERIENNERQIKASAGDRRGVHRRHAAARVQAAREGQRGRVGGQPAPRAQAEDGHASRRPAAQQNKALGAGQRDEETVHAEIERPDGREGSVSGERPRLADSSSRRSSPRPSSRSCSSGSPGRSRTSSCCSSSAIMISLYLGALAGVLQRRLRIPAGWSLAAAVLHHARRARRAVLHPRPAARSRRRSELVSRPAELHHRMGGGDRPARRRAFPRSRDVYEPGEHKLLLAVYEQVAGQFSDVVPKVFGIVEVLISLFSVCVMALYLALHPALYREWLIALFPPIHRDLVRDVLTDCADSLRAVHRRPAARDDVPRDAHGDRAVRARRAVRAHVRRVHRARDDRARSSGRCSPPRCRRCSSSAGPDGGTRALWVIVRRHRRPPDRGQRRRRRSSCRRRSTCRRC